MDDKYVFLDRDGVINKDGEGWTDHGYITRREDFQFLPGVLEALQKLTDSGYKNVVISNQKCVRKGLMSEDTLKEITDAYLKEVEDHGGKIEGVFYCIHLNEDECDCRKPKPGLLLRAQRELGIESFDGKFFIGDSERDMKAAKAVGLNTVFVTSGKYSREDAAGWETKPDHICEDLLDAVKLILN